MSSNVDFKDVADGTKSVDPNHPCASHLRILDSEAGLIERVRDRVAIVGYATSTRDMAPFDDPAYDIVGLNQLYRMIPRADVWADIHYNWEQENVEGTDHRGWLANCGIPVLMSVPDAGIPTAVRFPLEACIQIGADYFTSTVAYLVAWAIHQGYKRIELYGIDLVVGTEYEHQKACAEFWLGLAHGRGIEINLPPQSALVKHTHRYGFEKPPDWGLVGDDELAIRIAGLTKNRDECIAHLHGLDGAIHTVLSREEWLSDPDKKLEWLRDQHGIKRALVSTLDGALQEVTFWRELFTLRSRGAMPRKK